MRQLRIGRNGEWLHQTPLSAIGHQPSAISPNGGWSERRAEAKAGQKNVWGSDSKDPFEI
jgi:hypothetical protein